MPETSSLDKRPIVIGGTIGILLGTCLLVFAFFTTFSICSDSSFAEVLFPYSLSVDPGLFHPVRGLIALLLALVQYPIYGSFLGFIFTKRHSLLGLCLVAVLILHGVVVGVAKHRVRALREEKFSQMDY